MMELYCPSCEREYPVRCFKRIATGVVPAMPYPWPERSKEDVFYHVVCRTWVYTVSHVAKGSQPH